MNNDTITVGARFVGLDIEATQSRDLFVSSDGKYARGDI